MVFPIQILPCSTYKLIDCNLSDSYLFRHTSLFEFYDESSGLIKDKAVCDPSSSNMPDLSTNLLGVFEKDHIYIEIKDPQYIDYCVPNFCIVAPIFPAQFVLNFDRRYWFVKIESVNNIKVTYQYNNIDFIAVSKVVHTPMKWNFWHFSIHWFLPKENCYWHELSLGDRKKTWSKEKLAHSTRSIVKMAAVIECEPYPILDEIHYIV